MESLGLKAKKAEDIYGTTSIIQDIWELIWQARVVIADVTNRNPNVNYELGLCHALGVPTVLITQDMADVPFDYRHLRCIVYDTRQVDWQEKLRDSIIETVKVVLDGSQETEGLRWPYDTNSLRASGRSEPFISAEDARETLSRALNQGFDSISRALGPHGTSVSAASQFGGDKSYRSGFAIASALNSADPLARKGLEQIAAMTREIVAELGDGTKTAALLFCTMVLKGFSQLQNGATPRDLIHEMDLAVERAVGILKEMSEPVNNNRLLCIATTAALGDVSSGRLVQEAMTRASIDGVLTIEDSTDLNTELIVQEGMYFDRGFISRRFITDESRQLAILENPVILIYGDKLNSMRRLLPLLEQVALSGRSLLVIADDVEGEALATLETNQIKGTLSSVAVRSPGFASRLEILEDIAIATGGTVISHPTLLEQARLSQLGQADRIEVTSGSTWLIGSRGKRELIEARAAGIRQQITISTADFEKEKLWARLAKLVGATAIIRVGGASVVDREERKYRIETALHSSRSAMASGAIPGGGAALWRASRAVKTECQNNGGDIVSDALTMPLLAQIKNARVRRDPILEAMESASEVAVGFDALRLDTTDLDQAGVLDSTQMILRGLQIAFAHSRKMLQTGAWEIAS